MNPQRRSGQGPELEVASAEGRSVSPSSSRRPASTGAPSARTARRGWRDLDARLLGVLGRITERDRRLCRLLDEHRVLTTAQVADVAFSGERRARMRLSELYGLEVLDRFRPQAWGGSAPYHWVLGPLGAALVAAEAGRDVGDLSWRRSLAHEFAASQRLAHLVGTNGFFTALLRAARTSACCELSEWWSERRCAREWGEVVRPDGYGVWREAATSFPFLYEHDNGTERLERLGAKLEGYVRLGVAAGHANWVLFTFPTPRREREARRVLVHPNVPVATAARPAGFAPDGVVWAATGTAAITIGARVPLSELAALAIHQP